MKKLITLLSLVLLISTTNIFASGNNEVDEPENRMERPEGQDNHGPDFDKVAEELGVTVDEFIEAMGDPKDFSPEKMGEIAEKLGVTEEELMDAMGPPPGGDRPQKN